DIALQRKGRIRRKETIKFVFENDRGSGQAREHDVKRCYGAYECMKAPEPRPAPETTRTARTGVYRLTVGRFLFFEDGNDHITPRHCNCASWGHSTTAIRLAASSMCQIAPGASRSQRQRATPGAVFLASVAAHSTSGLEKQEDK